MNNLEKLQQLTRHVQVAHHIPGRIRLKLKSQLPDSLQLNAFKHSQQVLQFIESLPGVKTVRPNLLARSCVVEYDHKVLSQSLWEALLQGRDSPEVITLLAQIEQHFQQFQAQQS